MNKLLFWICLSILAVVITVICLRGQPQPMADVIAARQLRFGVPQEIVFVRITTNITPLIVREEVFSNFISRKTFWLDGVQHTNENVITNWLISTTTNEVNRR